MISKVSDAMVQHRHVVLMLGLLVAGLNVAAVGFVPTLGQRLFIPLLFLTLAVLVLALITLGIRPAYFVVQPQFPAFAAPAPAWQVFIALGSLAPASASIGALVRSTRAGIVSTFDVVANIPWVVLIALLLVEAWRGHGVQLHPYGIRQPWALGSLTVPWEALPAAQIPPGVDHPSRLRMAIAEPQLVRRRGIPWSRKALRTDNIDAGFLAAAIRHYVCHPEHRVAIGSQDEYQRLLAELPDWDGWKDTGDDS